MKKAEIIKMAAEGPGGWNLYECVKVRLNGKVIVENWSCFIKSDLEKCEALNDTTDYEVETHDDYSTNWQVDDIRITG